MLHRARLIVVFMLFGAVVNVLVAWGCALWSPLEFGRMSFEYDVDVSRLNSIPPEWWEPPYHFNPPIIVTGERVSATGHGLSVVRSGVCYLRINSYNYGPDRCMMSLRAGFPFRSLEAAGTYDPYGGPRVRQTSIDWEWALRTPDHPLEIARIHEQLLLFMPPRPLPLRPVPMGFVLNTAIYAIAAALYVLQIGARRAMRRRRGLCIHCGYDARSLAVCPECGHACATSPASRVARDAGGG